jgi:Cys-rich protein (TIGR01571 family)
MESVIFSRPVRFFLVSHIYPVPPYALSNKSSCVQTGFCHPSLCCSLWCTQIAMAQVMSRMQLTWLGRVGPASKTNQTFLVILLLVIAFFVYSVALEIAALPYMSAPQTEPIYLSILRIGGDLLFSLWAFVALCQTRKTVRQRYQIPEQYCKGCEDACCSLWCGCCVTAQMMRHTGEYDTYAGVCCSATGHPPGAPLVV